MALDGTSEYSGHQTLRSFDNSPELLACATPQQQLEAALQCHGCNTHPNPHSTPHVGAIRSCFVALNQVLHTWVSCTYRFHCSYVDGKSIAVQHGNLYNTPSHQPTKNPLKLATIFNHELIAGAHSFFGIWALQVGPLPLPLLDDEPTC